MPHEHLRGIDTGANQLLDALQFADIVDHIDVDDETYQ
jgi:hypothetical protein